MMPWQRELVRLHGVEDRLWKLYKAEENENVKAGLSDLWNKAYHEYHERLKEVAESQGVDKDCLNAAVQMALGHVDSMEGYVAKAFADVKRIEEDLDKEEEVKE